MNDVAAVPRKPKTVWLLLAVWLTYSLGALWWLETDAASSGAICSVRNR